MAFEDKGMLCFTILFRRKNAVIAVPNSKLKLLFSTSEDYKTFLDFVLAMENKSTPQAETRRIRWNGLAIRIRTIGRTKFLESQNPSAQESERILFNVSFLQILMLLSLVAIFSMQFSLSKICNLPPSVSGNSILLEAFRHSPHGLCRAQLGGYTDGFGS